MKPSRRGGPSAGASTAGTEIRTRLTAAHLPHLSAFLDGYLHQDFALDHETPARALQAFLSECGTDAREGFKRDWQVFAAAIEGMAWHEVRRVFAALGGAWAPATRADLDALVANATTDRGHARPKAGPPA
jgi:hypothetical protein